uniref:NLR family CARD domain containing 3 n=1 Tax=Leptobrachium leishanense TaxID=445787 RepID=A0A8C5WIF7_9ANUR
MQELQMLTEEEIKMLQEFTSPPMQAEVLLDTLVGKGKSYLQALQNCIEFSRFYLYLRMHPLVLKHLERVESKEKHTLLTQLDSLFMVEGLTDAQLQEHDVLQLELRQGGRGTPRQLPLEKLLLPLSEVTFPPHITLTVGVAGAGKSTLVRLFVERWIRGEVCPNITCMMVLNLWELNIYDRLSTEKLLRLASPRQAGPLVGSLLILDGLDELRALLDFSESIACTDPQKELSPECLITNILRGNLLTDTSIWITSRPGAAACIPGGLVDRMTEISGLAEEDARGFLEQLLPDTNGFAQRVWDHLQSHRSLKALCSVPALCRIIGTSLGSLLHAQDSPFLPGTLSAIFSWYLKAVVCDSDGLEQIGSARRTIANLGRLAFNGLIRRRTVFYESDLKSCGIETPLIPGSLCARLLLSQNSPSSLSFAFSHLCLQEFLAAIHYHLAAKRAIFDLFADGAMSWPKLGYMNHYKSAVQKAQHADDLQIPIFLRFLSGLLSPQVLRALSGCLPGKEEPGGHSGAAVDYLHSLLIAGKNVSCRAVNLVCCLQELGHTELIKGVEEDLEKGTLGGKLSMLGCSALAYLLRTSNSCAHETNLSQCLTYKLVQILLPQLQYCTGIRMENNNFKDDVMELLASVLHNKDCTIQRLSLAENRLSNRGVKVLGKALMVNRTLVSLDIWWLWILPEITNNEHSCCSLHSNSIGPSGVKTLAEALINNQVLLNLNLQENALGDEGTSALSGALRENSTLLGAHGTVKLTLRNISVTTFLVELLSMLTLCVSFSLQGNNIGQAGAKVISDTIKNGAPGCKVEI